MPVEVFLPKMSDHMQSGVLLRWLVPEGASVQARQPLLEIETDKAVGEVESPATGILRGVRAREGADVPVGEILAFIAQPDEQIPQLEPIRCAAEVNEPPASELTSSTPQDVSDETTVLAAPAARRVARELGIDLSLVKGSGPGGRIKEADVRSYAEAAREAPTPAPQAEKRPATPVARKIAREHGIDLNLVAGSGPGGRITQEDVLAYVELAKAPPAPSRAREEEAAKEIESPAKVAEIEADDVEWMELSTIRRLTGERMTWSAHNVPHFVLSTHVDMTETGRLRQALMEKVLEEAGERLSYTALLIKVVAKALKLHPLANAEYAGGKIKIHKAIHIGVAVGSQDGLVVPVIQHADRKTLKHITRELKAFREKSVTLRFSVEDLSHGTFTISNLGMYGVDHFSAIINPPQSAILAVGQIQNKPLGLADGSIALRPMMSLSLSIDHRVLDGVAGALFLAEIKRMLTNPLLLLGD